MALQRPSLTHLVRGPSARTDGPPPLLLLLHGVGSHEGDLMALAPYLDGRFFIVGARAPLEIGPGSYAWYTVDFSSPARPVLDPEQPGRSRQILLGFVDELVDTYGLDRRRVYLMGFSQGAIMSIGAALARPDLFAGIVAMSGRLIQPLLAGMAAPTALTGLPMLVIHGTEDDVLPVDDGRAIKDFLERLPVDLTYREYPMGHQITEESLGEAVKWLSERLDGTRPGY